MPNQASLINKSFYRQGLATTTSYKKPCYLSRYRLPICSSIPQTKVRVNESLGEVCVENHDSTPTFSYSGQETLPHIPMMVRYAPEFGIATACTQLKALSYKRPVARSGPLEDNCRSTSFPKWEFLYKRVVKFAFALDVCATLLDLEAVQILSQNVL